MQRAVNFKDADVVLLIDFPPRRLSLPALVEHVSNPGLFQLHIFEAVLADPQVLQPPIFLGIWREVPSANFKLTKADLIDELDTRKLKGWLSPSILT